MTPRKDQTTFEWVELTPWAVSGREKAGIVSIADFDDGKGISMSRLMGMCGSAFGAHSGSEDIQSIPILSYITDHSTRSSFEQIIGWRDGRYRFSIPRPLPGPRPRETEAAVGPFVRRGQAPGRPPPGSRNRVLLARVRPKRRGAGPRFGPI